MKLFQMSTSRELRHLQQIIILWCEEFLCLIGNAKKDIRV